MDSVFTLLKQAREAKNLSLADVADSTFISIRYLEAIEAGRTDILPQAYVRAFIREYAAVVGLDPAEIMRRYDNPTPATAPASSASPAPTQTVSPAETPPPAIVTPPVQAPEQPFVETPEV